MTEVLLGCGHAWLIDPELTDDVGLCYGCYTAQPVLARFENATSGQVARLLGGRIIIETVEVR